MSVVASCLQLGFAQFRSVIGEQAHLARLVQEVHRKALRLSQRTTTRSGDPTSPRRPSPHRPRCRSMASARMGRCRTDPIGQQVQRAAREPDRVDLGGIDKLLQRQGLVLDGTNGFEFLRLDHHV